MLIINIESVKIHVAKHHRQKECITKNTMYAKYSTNDKATDEKAMSRFSIFLLNPKIPRIMMAENPNAPITEFGMLSIKIE